jgi:Fur family transcriptional regulator, ferric uptake regulator
MKAGLAHPDNASPRIFDLRRSPVPEAALIGTEEVRLSTREIRNTRQKTAIREALAGANRPLSPEEVLRSAQQHQAGVGIATVYRNIQTLVEEGWLQPVEVPGDATRYEVTGKKHHHHFQCNECGKLYDLEGCAAQSRPKLPRGFRASGHEFYFYGTCAACVPAK